jgi:hypothetical protein
VQNWTGESSVPAWSFPMIRGSIRAHASHAGTSGISTSAQYKHDASSTSVDRMSVTSRRTTSVTAKRGIPKLFLRVAC